ncbi:MAG: hypothetical protein BroJett025_05680 [Patescibacteria group bacterium]|nr:MAG: hypothetical protein BroJett025_05680 [Patescibacteria group bacterium]
MIQLRTKKYYLFASLLVVGITFAMYRGVDALVTSSVKKEQQSEVYLVPVTQIPVLKEKLAQTNTENVLGEENFLTLEEFSQTVTAKSVYVEDLDTGTVLFERNSERILLPASTTKLMTALIALEEYQLNDVILVPQLPKLEGLKFEFRVGEKITVENLLKAALIQSSNDAAYILALSSERGLDGFVARMNERAKELHLINTQYKNPAGFDDDTQRSSAHDLVVLSKVFMKDNFLASVVAIKEAVITDISGEYEHYLTSTHQLLGVDPTVVGIKTGTTQGAAQVLITQFSREGHNIIVVVMGSDDRYLETTRLVDWIFSAYLWIDPKNLI